jgi:folate-dependent phosphoribosylglycinamide formyltransferase PurN
VKQLIYDPSRYGAKMNIVCFVSGSGTNYREIVAMGPDHNYLVFTNRPGCGAVDIARRNGHEVVELSHELYLKGTRSKYGPGNTPRNCAERIKFDQDVSHLIENKLKRKPDLICLAGYDQWITDWLVDRYYPTILNVHPGDTTKGYVGLHWTPTAKAILAGDKAIRSTLFVVDKGEDTGPVLVQSRPMGIAATLTELESKGIKGLLEGLEKITAFAGERSIKDFDEFKKSAGSELLSILERLCRDLQESLKVAGDWEIYPFAVHQLIAKGRVSIEGKQVFIDNKPFPPYGLRMEQLSDNPGSLTSGRT